MRRIALLSGLLILLAGVHVGPHAGTAAACSPNQPPTPIAFLKANDARAKELLASTTGDSLPATLRDTLKRQINRVFDFALLSRLALGEYWDERTPAERDHFVDVFSAIIQEQNFDSFVRYFREGDIRYDAQEVVGDSARVLASVPLRDQEIAIEYVLHTAGEDWQVYDLVVDGVSTAEGNRRRYARYIEKHSYEKLIAQLEKQLARLRNVDDQ